MWSGFNLNELFVSDLRESDHVSTPNERGKGDFMNQFNCHLTFLHPEHVWLKPLHSPRHLQQVQCHMLEMIVSCYSLNPPSEYSFYPEESKQAAAVAGCDSNIVIINCKSFQWPLNPSTTPFLEVHLPNRDEFFGCSYFHSPLLHLVSLILQPVLRLF